MKKMEEKKAIYIAPEVQVFEMEVQSLIAASSGTSGERGGYGSGGEW